MASKLDELCVNTIRMLSADGVEKANSGHPGMPMGAAPMAYVLWTRFLRHNPLNPGWSDRDRFILSAGHGSMLLYSLLHLTGYDLSVDDLKEFRQWKSKTPGHPEYSLTPGVEITTGPLGQGFASGVGMAIAERFLAAYFNRPGHAIVDHFTYGIVSDGDGYGSDGKAWGGEVFHKSERIGNLEEQHLLGGDSATLNPEKFLLALMWKVLPEEQLYHVMTSFFQEQDIKILLNQLKQYYNIVQTTSTGRIFDAASYLLGICKERTFDGQPAIMLEQASSIPLVFDPIIETIDSRKTLMTTPLFEFLHENPGDKAKLAATVQRYIALGLLEIARSSIAGKSDLPIVFSGGCAVNKIMRSILEREDVLLNLEISCGDQGISCGQAAYLTLM